MVTVMITDTRVDVWQYPGVPGYWLSTVRGTVQRGKRDYVRWEYETGRFERPSPLNEGRARWFKGQEEAAGKDSLVVGTGSVDIASWTVPFDAALTVARVAAEAVWFDAHQHRAELIEADQEVVNCLGEQLRLSDWLASLHRHLTGRDDPVVTDVAAAANDVDEP